jgi:hypothetical protein
MSGGVTSRFSGARTDARSPRMGMLMPSSLLIFHPDVPLNYLSLHVRRRCRKKKVKKRVVVVV